MRVISGKAKGLRLYSPEGIKTRPTADFIKESLFNIIHADLAGCRFLDLFAGSGAIGIEALSRGALYGCFVDVSNSCAALIYRNLEKARLLDTSGIMHMEAIAAIKKLKDDEPFDIIFLDPPYFYQKDVDVALSTVKAIMQHGLLARNGYIIMEMSIKHDIIEDEYNDIGLSIFRVKAYSNTQLIFLEEAN